MCRIVASQFVTLDGVHEDPGGVGTFEHGGWALEHPDPGQFRYKLDEVLACEGLLLGRRTYEEMAAAWPSRSGAFADKMNGMHKHVVSRTLGEPAWSNSTVLRGEPIDEVRALRDRPGRDVLLVGSRTLTAPLLGAGLIDELRVMVFPVVLGSGAKLFEDGGPPSAMELESTTTFQSGTVVLTYRTSPH